MSALALRFEKQGETFDFGQDDMEAILDRMEPRVRAAFIEAVLIAQQTNTLDELAELAAQGRLAEAIGVASEAGSAALADALNVIFVESGSAVALSMAGEFETIVSFNQVNTRAVNMMQDNRLRLIREFGQEQRRATREALVDGIRRGLNPRDQARAFRGSIGLTERQQAAVNNFRRLLTEGSAEALTRKLRDKRFDPTIRRAIAGDIVLTEAQIEKMVSRYGERYLKFRAEVIARTEALRTVHAGTEEAFLQAIENNIIEPDTLERTWLVARDERLRSSHRFMSGQKRAIGQTFRSGNGNNLRYPGDINAPGSDTIQCRCVIATRVTRISLPSL